ncbi:MAG: transposase, partial [Phycisphaerae bacterium]
HRIFVAQSAIMTKTGQFEYRKIHVICDNAGFHDSRAVRDYLAQQGDRIVIHFLRKYTLDLNPIERI